MSEQIAVLSSGVWAIRDMVKQLTGYEPVRWLPPLKQPKFGCVVGWGLKPTSRKARQLAQRNDKNYIALEDGFVRSVMPGPNEIPVSLVVDRTGVYYDTTCSSDLERHIIARVSSTDQATLRRARAGMRMLRENRISKYNHAPYLTPAEMGLDPAPDRKRVLVVDQTRGDSSVSYGLADEASFLRMLEAAISENPGAEIIVKTHPEVVSGCKKGYLAGLHDPRVKLIACDVNPWALIELAEKVYVVTTQLGFEALWAGREVICFGAPFYAGWGLTDDRVTVFRRKKVSPTVEQMFAAVYFDYARYICPETKREIAFEDAVVRLVGARGTSSRT